ncbi:ABC transporter ATP-binding protein [Halobacillus sp. A5]|uniref:ABC transporter ATP-binding protein n=1 Tax=Halobacillus sp. A5 TaxID=2880263 RepID=UPI0020A6C85D|nr:ABC transporter ATP-binding protein [Halobacillus sp. A5]MCP3029272.1 ABC transporter ATP-binding protein [Halobacillus sp. A5]
MSTAIEVKNLSKAYGKETIINQLSFKLNYEEKWSIVGPSGGGKTTLLRILAGLDQPSSGTIKVDGESVIGIDARKRKVGLVFQQPLLFPHMTVEENITYGARLSGTFSKTKTNDLLEAVSLTKSRTSFPSELSGGQQQRTALARALAAEPKILLLDEPFSSLDPALRQELRYWVRRLLDEREITSIFVTHDREEAMIMGDKIGIFHNGEFQQTASAETILDFPANPFVVQFFNNHILINDNSYAPLSRITLFETDDPSVVIKAELLHTTISYGERIAHVYIKEQDKRLSLRLPLQFNQKNYINLFVPKEHIHSFPLSQQGLE